MKVERRTAIAAPAERVYDVVMDPQRLGDWVTIHDHLKEAPDGSLRKGSKLTQSLRLAGRRFTVRWTVVTNDPCKRVVWEGRGPVRTRARVEYGFEEDSGTTTFSYVNEYHLPGGPLAWLAGPAVQRVTARELDGSLARLKRLIE
jgi:uncharacterized membrane protein